MPKLTSTNHDAVRFGVILRRLRIARGWTILVAAQRCGMNPNYLGALEKGGNMPSVDTLLEIGDVYGVNASDSIACGRGFLDSLRSLEARRRRRTPSHVPRDPSPRCAGSG